MGRRRQGVERVVFTGEFRHAVDEKGRIAIPSRFRAQLVGGVFVARWLDACLAIHTRSAWDAITAKVDGLPMTDPAARLLERRLFGGATELALDGQGRLLLPENLRQFAALRDEAFVVGANKRVEIWAPDRWRTHLAEMEDDATFASAISRLGI